MLGKIFKKQPRSAYSLIYHAVDHPQDNPLVASNIHHVSPEHFHEQLSGIKKQGYRFLWMDEVVEALIHKNKLKHVIAITFDDGYASVINKALPVLQDLDIPATFYVNAALLEHKSFWRDKVRYLMAKEKVPAFLQYALNHDAAFQSIHAGQFYRQSKNPALLNSKKLEQAIDAFLDREGESLQTWQQGLYLDEKMLKPGKHLQFGNHTANHYVLASLSKDEQAEEIQKGENFLKQYDLQVSNSFSVPFGGQGTYNADTIDLIADMGYKGCLLSSGNQVKNIDAGNGISGKNIRFVNRFMPQDQESVAGITGK